MPGLYQNDAYVSGLPIFGLAAAGGGGDLEVSYRLLREYPPAIIGCGWGWMLVDGGNTSGDGGTDGTDGMDWD